MKLYYFRNNLKYYSLTTLFNDEYLILEDNCDKNIKEYFDITKKLNHDVLMLLINILVSNNKIIISSNDFNFFLSEVENMEWLFNDYKK